MSLPLIIDALEQVLPTERSEVAKLIGAQWQSVVMLILTLGVSGLLIGVIGWLRYRAAHPLPVPTTLEDALAEPETKPGNGDDPADWWK